MDSGIQHFALTGMSEIVMCGSFYKGKLAVWILSWVHQPGIQTTCDVMSCTIYRQWKKTQSSLQEQHCS
jgi:hypothetical protein